MKNITRHFGELKLVKRMKNSKLGNPQFLLSCNGYTFRTPKNSSLGYSVQKFIGKYVTINIGTHYGALTLEGIYGEGDSR